jgi:hypothetical protein
MAMKRKENREEKDFLQLRIEYLKQSAKYKAYCEWKRNLKIDPKSPIPEIFRPHSNLKPNLIEFQCQNNFVFYGDIHDPEFSFEKWWKWFRVQMQRSDEWRKDHPENYDFHSVKDATELIGKDIDVCVAKFKETHKRDPKPQELKNSFMEMMKATNHICFFVAIYPFFDRPIIKREFKEVLNGRMKDPNVRCWKSIFKASTIGPSTNHLRWDELIRHLRIYIELERGRKTPQILNTDDYYKNHGGDIETRKREVLMDREKARRIIEFVESGIFPGPYEKAKARSS